MIMPKHQTDSLPNQLSLHSLFLLFLVLKYGISYVVYGELYAPIHDNLDGEVVYNKVIGEFYRNGFDAAVFDVFIGGSSQWTDYARIFNPLMLIYAIFDAHTAYFLIEIFSIFIAYLGTFLLLRSLKVSPGISVLLSCTYALGIIYSAYGLGLYCAPLLLFFILRHEKLRLYHYILILFLGLNTNLALHGLFFCFAAVACTLLSTKSDRWKRFLGVNIAFGIGSVIAFSGILYSQFFGPPSHRTAWIMDGDLASYSALLAKFLEAMATLKPWNHGAVTPVFYTVIFILLGFLSRNRNTRKFTIITLSYIILAALLSTLAVLYRPLLPDVLQTIQFKRIGLYIPLLLIMLAGVTYTATQKRFVRGLILTLSGIYLIYATMILAGINKETYKMAFSKEERKQIGKALLNFDLAAIPFSKLRTSGIGFRSYYAQETYACFLSQKEAQRTLSVGLDPMKAAFNGIPVLDGYHVLYPLSYKLKFRKIIEAQLTLSNRKEYYDGWGSRVYTFVRDPEKIDLDFNAAKKLGGVYVLSKFPLKDDELSEVAHNCNVDGKFHIYEIL